MNPDLSNLLKHLCRDIPGHKLRLNLLFDEGTFRELDMFVTHRCVNFGMEKVDIPADGVITGHGLPEILDDATDVANACFRSLVNNMSIASGPQVAINEDRLSPTTNADSM